MNRRQKLKTVEQTLKVLTEGKEEILLENPLIASLLSVFRLYVIDLTSFSLFNPRKISAIRHQTFHN